MADNDQQAAFQESFITAGQLPLITSNRAPIQSRKLHLKDPLVVCFSLFALLEETDFACV